MHSKALDWQRVKLWHKRYQRNDNITLSPKNYEVLGTSFKWLREKLFRLTRLGRYFSSSLGTPVLSPNNKCNCVFHEKPPEHNEPRGYYSIDYISGNRMRIRPLKSNTGKCPKTSNEFKIPNCLKYRLRSKWTKNFDVCCLLLMSYALLGRKVMIE